MYKISFGAFILGYSLFLSSRVQSQCYMTAPDMVFITSTYGEHLQSVGVDTTHIDSVYKALREGILLKSQYAALYLAKQNKKDIIELILNKYNKEREFSRGAKRYLEALKMLNYNLAERMLNAFADSLYKAIQMKKVNDTEHYVYQSTVRLLMDYKNYSQFRRIVEIIKSKTKVKDPIGYLSLLIKFFEIEKFEDEVINTLIFVLNNYLNSSYRAQVANYSCLFPESTKLQQALEEAAVEDTSYSVRHWSLIRLQETYHSPNILELALANLETTNNRFQIEFYLIVIYNEYDPRSLFLIKKLKNSGPNQIVREEAADIYKYYWRFHFEPYGKVFNYSPSRTLDSLIAYTREIASYGWLENKGFVRELINRLENASRHLASGDSANAAKQIANYRKRLQKVYKKSQKKKRGGRFVKVDAYKFLYKNAGYLLKKLPDHPSKKGKKK